MSKDRGLTLRGSTWHMQIGSYRASCNTSDVKLARQIRAKKVAEFAENKHLDIKRISKLTFEQLIQDHYFKSAATFEKSWDHNNRTWLDYFLKTYRKFSLTPISEIDAPMIEQWKIERTRVNENDKTPHRVKKISVNKDLSYLRTVFNYAVSQKLIEKSADPFLEVKSWELKKHEMLRQTDIKPEQMDTLFQCCSNRSPMMAEMVTIYLATGMRKSEITKLERKQLKFELGERGMIELKEQKNGEIDYVPMTLPVRDILLKRSVLKEHPTLLFPGPGGGVYHFYKSWKLARKDANLDKVRLHDLRHAYACLLRDRGVDIYTIKELMRHKTISQTERYVHRNEKLKIEASKKMDDITIITQSNKTMEQEEFNKTIRQLE